MALSAGAPIWECQETQPKDRRDVNGNGNNSGNAITKTYNTKLTPHPKPSNPIPRISYPPSHPFIKDTPDYSIPVS